MDGWRLDTEVWPATEDEPGEKLSFLHPVNDLIQHDVANLRCACNPRWTIIIGYHRRKGCMCVLNEVVHHSLDGRELFE